MKKVLIIGGGFAGLSAARRLNRERDVSVTLVDKNKTSHFLPLLPDLVGRRIPPSFLQCSLHDLSRKYGFSFVQDNVTSVDFKGNMVKTASLSITFDFLILASGSQTNFYGQENLKNQAFSLGSVDDAFSILENVKQSLWDNFVIAGGGYTGIEIATHICRFLAKNKQEKRITVIERAGRLLANLPEEFRHYSERNLQLMNIDILLETTVKDVTQDRKVVLSNGEVFSNAMLIWTAGVKTGDLIGNMDYKKTRQGRLVVDEYLRLDECVFAAGDVAHIEHKGLALRMGVQFSLSEGLLAAENIIRTMKKKPLKPYRPVDLGYVVPMANGRSCGIVLGMPVYGCIPTFLHYFMGIYRSWTWENRIGILKSLIKGE